jgi:uncharacterized protein YbjT (DUF2867 family)
MNPGNDTRRKLIAVTGATGAQGGGLARAILQDPRGGFAVRAITRKTSNARALVELGAEVVEADLDDAESLRRAFDGAYGGFFVTNFWEHFSPEKELAQARNLAQAARAVGLEHVIWSTLEDTRERVPLSDPRMPTLQDKYKVPHFDGKGEADAFFAGLPVTYLLTSFYWDNLIHFGMGPKRRADGRLAFTLPMGDKKLPGIAAQDIGRAAYGVFRRGADATEKRIGIAGEHLSGAEMAAALSVALGQEVVHDAMSPADYRALGFPGADDLGNMFQYKAEFEREFRASRDVAATRALNPRLQTFAQWLDANKERIPPG